MKKSLTFLLSLAMTTSPLVAAEKIPCLQAFETPYEIVACLDKRGRELQKSIQALTDTLKKRQASQTKSVQAQLSDALNKYQALQGNIQKLLGENQQLNATVEQLVAQLAQLTQALEQVKTENADNRRKAKKAQKMAASKATVDQLVIQFSQLTQALEQVKTENVDNRRALQSEIKQLQKEKQQLKTTVAQLATRLEKLPQELKQVKKEKVANNRRKVDKAQNTIFRAGNTFRDRLKDGSKGPKMVWIPSGSFGMGDIQGDGDSDEKPVHHVSVNRFAMGKYEVTFAEYDKFANATRRKKPSDNDWGRGNRPVMNVTWYDAVAYTEWLTQQTGQQYRLPTEAEWEYAARAGTETKYWWGNNIGKNRAVCNGCGSRWDGKRTAPVGSFSANPFGLHDTVGNVWEWTCSEYESKYKGKEKRCLGKYRVNHNRLVLRGGSWDDQLVDMRSASRYWWWPTSRYRFGGFRLARGVIAPTD
ncbi:SUMF1/EgtB/PvdO family nonheme iron enzyme [Candidatus Parabeggiatoa sp. HSG14]|uniref:formylglycine-generating enzyme family protein n=1 Tax=Candidatus Parabeggiatoa sp. HSG14 TaxID=3055593 RepID=UPI0025A79C3A|nr:SUMF1/EgtB/PvdO family nonheme iron enzyme [Thiotrichales bacterium HSG14]